METAHPITVVQTLYKKAAILLIPTARGIYYFFAEESQLNDGWLSGMWIDFLLLLFLIAVAVCNWKAVGYKTDNDSILLKKGFLYKSEKIINRKSITSITCHSPVLHRAVKAQRVYVDTEGGYKKHTDMNFTIRSHEKNKFFSQTYFGKTYRPKLPEIFFLSLCITDTLASTVYTVLLINRAGKIIGRDILTEFIGIAAKAGSYIALAVIIMQFIGIIRNFLYYSKFTVRRYEDSLYFENGFFSKTKSMCRISAINYIDRRQNLISSIFCMDMVFIQCTGYGKARKKEALLIPTSSKKAIDSCIKMLVPELYRTPEGAGVKTYVLRPSPKAFARYIRMPLLICMAILTAGIMLMQKIILPYFPEWIELAKFSIFMTVVPCILFVAVRAVAFRKAYILYEDTPVKMVTLCYYKGLNIHTVSFYSNKITHIKIRRSIFQYKNKTCDVILYTGGEGGHKHSVKGLCYDPEYIHNLEKI